MRKMFLSQGKSGGKMTRKTASTGSFKGNSLGNKPYSSVIGQKENLHPNHTLAQHLTRLESE